ncbi:hypothetical protein B7494_g7674 [Chlorociboria aeruginascens]|nr:hypothetical protein B7494_g7674 [Chlorociboria aeruginascens]
MVSMVTRKPVAVNTGPQRTTPNTTPYPVTPITTEPAPSFSMQNARQDFQSATDSESNSATAWAHEKPDSNNELLQPRSSRAALTNLPDSLRVGPPGYSPRSSQELLRPVPAVTNPYLQKIKDTQTDGKESSADAWEGFAGGPAQPSLAPPPPPPAEMDAAPTEKFTNLYLAEQESNPWQPRANEKAPERPQIPSFNPQDSGNEVWSTSEPTKAPPPPPPSVWTEIPKNGALIEEPESPAWDEDGSDSSRHATPPPTQESQQLRDEQDAWGNAQIKPKTSTNPFRTQAEGWNLIDHEPLPGNDQDSGVVNGSGAVIETFPKTENPPELPPRTSEEHSLAQPPRPTISDANRSTSSAVDNLNSNTRKQRKETYEIKKITWYDATAIKNPRISPILVQNANGPCPLLALVNALTLSTPANVETALVETLRSREQVSLGLLLDAVFDELMSGRRGHAAQELPDVSDLYQFLVTLHTGMNVNPRFFASPPNSSNDPRNSMSHIHPSGREEDLPGTFEDTREMKLYSTFSVPLIHGWLPPKDSPAYIALFRSAKSYEDAQNLMFREEELEDKLQREGLGFEEQATLEDIATIKAFFASAATQLTPFGLKTITYSLAPGAVAIFFRNDHFSTLYRHPDTLQLLQLVTDMGYASHEEVVWESLTDVNGENAEFFSGDFRVVGGAPATPQSENPGWTSAPGNRPNLPQSVGPSNSRGESMPRSPTTEQEDHDLALALQLQEEEEERHRAELARRRRETELSQQYIEQQGNHVPVSQRGGRDGPVRGNAPRENGRNQGPTEIRPTIPPRRQGSGAPAVRPVDSEAGVDAPPPTYEQAATETPYVPPSSHPAHPNSSSNANARRRLSESVYSANNSSVWIGVTPICAISELHIF